MTQSINKILVAVDFSDISKNCIRTAITIASRQKASLILMYAFEQKNGLKITDVRNRLREYYTIQKESIAYAISKEAPEYEIKIRSKNEKVSEAINHVVKEEKIDLIIMGKYGLNGTLKNSIGSSLRATLDNVNCPILVVPPEGVWLDLSKIVLPIRLIQEEIGKYEYLRSILHINKAELLIAGFSKSDAPGKVKELLALVKEIKSQLKEDKVKITTHLSVSKTIGWEIISIARGFYADLIVLSPQLDGASNKNYKGLYSKLVLDNSKIPTLCLR